jgi:hypothetical protein
LVYTDMNTKSKNLDGYGTPPIDWERVRDTLTSDIAQAPGTGGPDRHTPWLTTINPDGSPHLTPVGFVQLDGVWYFTSGPGTRKSRNIAADPRCVVSVATHPFDLVIEGRAGRVTDADELRSVADANHRGGWPSQVEGDALTAEYSAPSAGPPPWHVYKITPATVFAFGTAEPYGATRFDLTR